MRDTDIVVKPRDVMPAGATTLPAAYYVDAAYFAREIDAFFRRMWICVGRSEELSEPAAISLLLQRARARV